MIPGLMVADVPTAWWVLAAIVALVTMALATSVAALTRARDALARAEALRRELDTLRTTVSAAASPPAVAPRVASVPPVAASAPAASSAPSWSPAIEPARDAPAPAAPHVAPLAPAPRAISNPPTPRHDASLEERIGVTWFTRIGAAVLIVGAASALKYLADSPWLGPRGRVGLGALAGLVVLVLAEWLHASLRRAYVHALLGLGLALGYVAAYAAYGFYALVGAPLAFGAFGALSAAGAALSLRHRSQSTLVIALGAALACPALLAAGARHDAALCAYVLVVTSVALAVAWRARFAGAAWLAVAGALVLPFALRLGPGTRDAPPWVDLGFTALCVAQWSALGALALREGWPALRPRALLAVAVTAAPFGALAALADGAPGSAGALALALLVAHAASALVLRRCDWSAGLALATAASALALVAGAPEAAASDGAWFALVAIWAAIPLADSLDRLVRRRAEASRATLALVVVGPVAAALVLLALGSLRDAPALGAAASLLAAAASLGAWAVLVRTRRDVLRASAELLLAPAALTAIAAALVLDRPGPTLAWAGLGFALALASARLRVDALAVGALGLFALAVLRAAGIDAWPAPGALHAGASPWLGAGAASLCGTGAALLASAWRWRRDGEDSLRLRSALVLLVAGHALLLGWWTLAARALAASDADPGRRAVAVTLALGLYGAGLLAAGFVRRSVAHRWLGLGLIAATLAKLALVDVWVLPKLDRVLLLVSVGALLLGAGFLYARFGPRVARLLRPDAD